MNLDILSNIDKYSNQPHYFGTDNFLNLTKEYLEM